MTTQTAPLLTGVVPPVCTPLTADGEVDVASMKRLVDFLVDGGVDGLFSLGSTSEVAFLTDRQRAVVLETVITQADGRVPVLAGAIDMTTSRVVEHAREAVMLGCDGVVATGPFYTRTHRTEIDRHFRLVAERIDSPVYAYDVPVSVHSKLDSDTVLDLAADGVIAGLKDSSGDVAGLRRLLIDRTDRGLAGFSVLTGAELTVDLELSMGVDGVVPGLGNVDPAGYTRLYRLCRTGDWDAARIEQERLVRLMRIVDVAPVERMGRGSCALGAFKEGLHLRGVIDCARTAEPQIPLNDEEIAAVREKLVTAGLL